MHKFRIFHSQEDFHLVGFNTLEKDQNWEGRLVKSDENILDLYVIRELNRKGFLVCLDGKPIINNKTMKRYEYSSLDLSKEYRINLNGGALGLFYMN